jgi:hypothetical protein
MLGQTPKQGEVAEACEREEGQNTDDGQNTERAAEKVKRLRNFIESAKEKDDSANEEVSPKKQAHVGSLEKKAVELMDTFSRAVGGISRKAAYDLTLVREEWCRRSKMKGKAAKAAFAAKVKKEIAEEVKKRLGRLVKEAVDGRYKQLNRMFNQGELLAPLLAVLKTANPWEWTLHWAAIGRGNSGVTIEAVKEAVRKVWGIDEGSLETYMRDRVAVEMGTRGDVEEVVDLGTEADEMGTCTDVEEGVYSEPEVFVEREIDI